MRPSGARCTLIGTQPKVDLIAVDDDEPPVRVAVCPLDASSDEEATRTQDRLARVLAVAADKPVFTTDTEPPLVTICMRPLDDVVAENDEDDAQDETATANEDDDSHPSDNDAVIPATRPNESAPNRSDVIPAYAGRPPRRRPRRSRHRPYRSRRL